MEQAFFMQKLNPKIRTMIEEVFPNIVAQHIRTRPPVEKTGESLERYRSFAARVLRGLPPAEQEINQKALEDALEEAYRKIREFHGREEGISAGTDAAQRTSTGP